MVNSDNQTDICCAMTMTLNLTHSLDQSVVPWSSVWKEVHIVTKKTYWTDNIRHWTSHAVWYIGWLSRRRDDCGLRLWAIKLVKKRSCMYWTQLKTRNWTKRDNAYRQDIFTRIMQKCCAPWEELITISRVIIRSIWHKLYYLHLVYFIDFRCHSIVFVVLGLIQLTAAIRQ